MKLTISPKFTLPLEAVTQTFAILAKRGVGKTYTAAVMAEELLAAGQVVCIIDPIGVWWGLRASADGKREGLPIIVFGGDHGDVPLEASAGELIADVIIERRVAAVVDLSHLRKGEQVKFMEAFAERLYYKNREPLHLIVDEADAYAPQNPLPGTQRLLGAMEDLVRRGRARGLGVTLITQRPAVLNKNVLTQIEVLVALRMVGPQDRKAIDEWVNAHGTPEERKHLMDSLPSLPVGTAWFWSPGWLNVFQRVEIRTRKTFDSSATPKPGVRVKAPERLAAVDIEALRGSIGELVEKAKADDPRTLKARIAELEHAAEEIVPAAPALDVEAVRGEARDEGYLLGYADGRQASFTALLKHVDWERQEVGRANAAIHRNVENKIDSAVEAIRTSSLPQEVKEWGAKFEAAAQRPSSPARVAPKPTAPAASGAKLAGGERKILTALAQYPQGRTKNQVGILAGYAINGGGFNNYLGALRSRGWIEGSGDRLQITANGRAALGSFTPLPTGKRLREYWMEKEGKAPRAILAALAECGPLNKVTLAAECGYEANGGGFNNALGRLRSLELIRGGGGGEIALSRELEG